MAERDYSIDILKGIGIILVIVGHSIPWEHPLGQVNHFIYSFHMPLFFLVSGYLFKKTSPRELFKKDFKRLIIPYLWVSGIILLSFIVKWIINPNYQIFDNVIKPLLWGAGGDHIEVVVFSDIQAITQLWFLLALFWGRFTINLLPDGLGGLIFAIALSVIGTIIGRYIIFLPTDINEGISSVVFLLIGIKIKEAGINWPSMIICILFWFISLYYFELSMSNCMYDCYPVQVLGATGGTFVFYAFSKLCIRVKYLNTGLVWFGINSMAILCLHTIESHTGIWNVLGISNMMRFPCRIVFCVLFTVILSEWEYSRSILGIKKLNGIISLSLNERK